MVYDNAPPYHSDADEFLEAVVAAGFGGVEGAIRDCGLMELIM
jgi:hypothetical protein